MEFLRRVPPWTPHTAEERERERTKAKETVSETEIAQSKRDRARKGWEGYTCGGKSVHV